MKKAAFKFKPGSGTILAFLLLAFVFASVAGVVYIVIAQGPGKTPQAAGFYKAVNLATSNQTCNSGGKVNLAFNWTAGKQAGFMVRERQLLDLSLANDNFGGVHLSASNPPSKDATSYMTGQGQIGQLDSGKTYFWRINTHYLNENWRPSATATFTTMPCQQSTAWILNQPIVNGNSVAFSFSPASNGYISLIVKNASTGAIVFDSGAIASGKMSLVWYAQKSGSYSAVLVAFGTASVSNTVTFSVPGVVASPSPTPPPVISCTQVDFDRDGTVTILDITLIANANGTKVGDPKFNKVYDLNGDGVISQLDIDIVSGFFGQKCIPTVVD